jgi:hypothetical protein
MKGIHQCLSSIYSKLIITKYTKPISEKIKIENKKWKKEKKR